MIFESRSKQKVLNLLIHQPRRYMSANELAVKSGVSPSRVQGLMRDLVKKKFIDTLEYKQQRWYHVNTHSSLWQDMQESGVISSKRTSVSRANGQGLVERVVRSLPGVKFAALTGVYIGRVRSSVDVLLVGDVPEAKLARVLKTLEDAQGAEINYALFSEQEFQNRRYSFDWFVKEILDHNPFIIVDKLNHRHAMRPEKYLKTIFSKVRERE